jgi:hypothetical protein
LRERTGWSLISHILTMHSETWLVSDHPVSGLLRSREHTSPFFL